MNIIHEIRQYMVFYEFYAISGLFEGDIISCKQIQDVQTISSVQVMASNQKDWEMLVCHFQRYRSRFYAFVYFPVINNVRNFHIAGSE